MSEKAERKTLPVKFKCDVCEMPDGKPNIQDVLMRCKSCGVCVHQTCYGKKVTEKADPDWLCWACEAVRDGREEKRPTECSLCSVEHGIHAMHPLFDKPGPHGKQKILPATEARGGKPERKAWVHTLCAYYVNSYKNTLGCVFGCDIHGDYDDGDVNVDEDEEHEFEEGTGFKDRYTKYGKKATSKKSKKKEKKSLHDDWARENPNSKNKKSFVENIEVVGEDAKYMIENMKDVGEEKNNDGTESGSSGGSSGSSSDGSEDSEDTPIDSMDVSHFVITSKNKNGTHNEWSRTIEEFRGLRCEVCGRDDKHALRIPVQCSFNSCEEIDEFKGKHPKDVGREPCYQAMHPGCARWGIDKGSIPQRFKRVFYFPGSNKEGVPFREPVANAFCIRHAEMIGIIYKRPAEKNRAKMIKRFEKDFGDKFYRYVSDLEMGTSEWQDIRTKCKNFWKEHLNVSESEFKRIFKTINNDLKEKHAGLIEKKAQSRQSKISQSSVDVTNTNSSSSDKRLETASNDTSTGVPLSTPTKKIGSKVGTKKQRLETASYNTPTGAPLSTATEKNGSKVGTKIQMLETVSNNIPTGNTPTEVPLSTATEKIGSKVGTKKQRLETAPYNTPTGNIPTEVPLSTATEKIWPEVGTRIQMLETVPYNIYTGVPHEYTRKILEQAMEVLRADPLSTATEKIGSEVGTKKQRLETASNNIPTGVPLSTATEKIGSKVGTKIQRLETVSNNIPTGVPLSAATEKIGSKVGTKKQRLETASNNIPTGVPLSTATEKVGSKVGTKKQRLETASYNIPTGVPLSTVTEKNGSLRLETASNSTSPRAPLSTPTVLERASNSTSTGAPLTTPTVLKRASNSTSTGAPLSTPAVKIESQRLETVSNNTGAPLFTQLIKIDPEIYGEASHLETAASGKIMSDVASLAASTTSESSARPYEENPTLETVANNDESYEAHATTVDKTNDDDLEVVAERNPWSFLWVPNFDSEKFEKFNNAWETVEEM